jgi:hypothetical protein
MRHSLFLAVSILCVANAIAHADPVMYTLSGIMSGSIGSTMFTDSLATWTFVGDTSGITSLGAGFDTSTDGISTITLAGVGTATFLSSTFGVESQFDGAAFYDAANGFGVGIYDPSLGYYALTSPFSDTAYFMESFAAGFGTSEPTTLGDLTITDGDFQNPTTTFQASAATPEPCSLLLLCTGLLTGAGVKWRRFRTAS